MSVENNIISFDFDGTIDDFFGGQENPNKEQIRDFIKTLIIRGYDVHIITRRYGPENPKFGAGMEHVKVLKIAEELGIPRNKIIFTNREWKHSHIKSIGACMHVDDDIEEKNHIEKNIPHVKMVWLGHENWSKELIAKIDTHDQIKIWFNNEKNIIKLGIVLAITLLSIFLLS